MIEGIPANSSTAADTDPRNQLGAISVRKRAIPKLTGTAMIIAIVAVTSVP
jgi:hypothetical protein